MTAVNNIPDAGNSGSLVSSLLSSLQASFGNDSAMQGLFASLLSQNEIPQAPPDNAQAQNQAAVNTPQTPVQDNSVNNGSPGVSSNVKTSSGLPQTARPVHQNAARTAVKSAANDKNSASGTTTSSNTANNSQGTGNQTSVNNRNSGQSSAQNTQTDNQNTNAGDNNSAASGNSDPGTTNIPNDGAVAVIAAAAASIAPPSDPSTGTQNTDSTQHTGSISGDLLALLLQLERLAAAQAQVAPATAGTDPVQPQGQTTDAAQSANAGTNADPGAKLDLKALLDALARLNSGDGTNTDVQATGDAAGQNADASLALATAAAPNAQQPSAGGAQQTTDKLANAVFFNQLNAAVNNQIAPPPVAAFTAAAVAGAAIGGGNGGAADADTQGQSDAGSHNGASAAADAPTLPLPANSTQAANPYDFASQLSALRATKGGPTGLPTPVEQVVLQLSRGLSKDGSSQMTIQLKPAELGRVDVKLTIASDGKVQGTVTADNSSTLGLLLKDVRGLERALQEAGLRADPGSLQFSLRGDGQAGGGFGQPAGNQAGSGGAAFDESTSLPVYADAAETYYVTPGGVNLRV